MGNQYHLLIETREAIMRPHQGRRVDFRRGQRLGRNDRRFAWHKGKARPKYLSAEEWAKVPGEMTFRILQLPSNRTVGRF